MKFCIIIPLHTHFAPFLRKKSVPFPYPSKTKNFPPARLNNIYLMYFSVRLTKLDF